MKISDNEIALYVDGQLDPKEHKRIEKIIQKDPNLERTVYQMRLANDKMFNFQESHSEIPEGLLSRLKQYEKNIDEKNTSSQTIKTNNFFKDWFSNIFGNLNLYGGSLSFASFAVFVFFGGYNIYLISGPSSPLISIMNAQNYTNERILDKGSTVIQRGIGDKVSTNIKCEELKKEILEKNFKSKASLNITVNNLETKKSFPLISGGFIHSGRTVDLNVRSDSDGKIGLIYHSSNNNSIKILDEKIQKNKDIILNSIPVNSRTLGEECIEITFEKNGKITKDLFTFSIVDFSFSENKLLKIDLKKPKDAKLISGKNLNFNQEIWSDGLLKKHNYIDFLLNKKILIWESNQISKGSFIIDFNNDGIGEIFAQTKENNSIQHYRIDRNQNSNFDVVVIPFKSENDIISYDWLFDDNEDGKFDAFGEDQDGDWKIEKITKF